MFIVKGVIMPKDTFINLPVDKKEKVLSVLKKIFKEKPFQEVTVKEIVEELEIARGSFYQYFEDLEDAYFTILDHEVIDIHMIFMKMFIKYKMDLKPALEEYGKEISEILFEKESYMIYMNRYLYWDESLSRRWDEIHNYHAQVFIDDITSLNMEEMHYVKAVIHSLIKRNYRERWTKEEFIKKYNQYINWIIGGVD